MRLALLAVMVLAPLANAEELSSPLRDQRRSVAGHVGSSPMSLMARGQYTAGQFTSGLAPAAEFTQGGGELTAEFGIIGFPTTLGGMFGFEGEFNLGLVRSEQYADGSVKDQRGEGKDTEDPAKLWLTTRLGARLVVSPTPLTFGDAAVRLGLVGGLQLEGSGARSYEGGGAFTAGAQLALGIGSTFGVLVSWLAVPPQQGERIAQLRHQLSLDLGIGPIAINVRMQFDQVDQATSKVRETFSVTSQTFCFAVGYRFDELKL